jgi:hypothetical protein
MTVHQTLISWPGESTTYYIRVDCTVSRTHVFANTVTDHPVERGANITDHVRPDPVRLNMVGVVSNAHIFLPANDRPGEQNVDDATGGYSTHYVNIPLYRKVTPLLSAGIPAQVVQTSLGFRPLQPPAGPKGAVMTRYQPGTSFGARVLSFNEEYDRARNVFEELRSLRDLGTLLRVETRLADYDDMVIESLTVPESFEVGDALQFELTLKQVILAESRLVPVPVLPTERKSKGTASTKEDANKPAAQSQSFLSWGVDSLTNWISK